MAARTVSTQTQNHTITVLDGSLIIDSNSELLKPDDIEQLLEVLLIWKYGLEEIASDNLEE